MLPTELKVKLDILIRFLAIFGLLLLLSFGGYYLYWHSRYEIIKAGGVPLVYDKWSDRTQIPGAKPKETK